MMVSPVCLVYLDKRENADIQETLDQLVLPEPQEVVIQEAASLDPKV